MNNLRRHERHFWGQAPNYKNSFCLTCSVPIRPNKSPWTDPKRRNKATISMVWKKLLSTDKNKVLKYRSPIVFPAWVSVTIRNSHWYRSLNDLFWVRWTEMIWRLWMNHIQSTENTSRHNSFAWQQLWNRIYLELIDTIDGLARVLVGQIEGTDVINFCRISTRANVAVRNRNTDLLVAELKVLVFFIQKVSITPL